jgi:MoaA/NifB/PqqE/SkfB family radical SAM enzyme
MNPAVMAKAARNALATVEINFNRLVGREFVPRRRDTLHIETSSLCNLKCRFCAYEKKQSPKVVMEDEFFVDCITQATEMGYRHFEMTPCTGDVFMDRHVFNKLKFLDQNPNVAGYQFFTNFTIPRRRDVERLVRLQKLKNLTISIYGHDLETFIAITKSTEKVYKRLIANLEILFGLLRETKFTLSFGFRSTRHVPSRASSEIMAMLDRFEKAGIAVHRSDAVYNNWGGYISKEDVRGLDMDVTGAEAIYKKGACVRLLTTVQIMATGIVNGCACRDADATLRIGDLNKAPLREILSAGNQAYMDLIDEQQRGQFRTICKSCDFYKSIYHTRSSYRRDGVEVQSLEEFKARLD